MTEKEFMRIIANGEADILQQFINLLKKLAIDHCVIGGLAVNSYVEPVVSMDLDIVIVAEAINKLKAEASKVFKLEEFPHSLNLSSSKSDLRIQIQTDSRYQPFIARSRQRNVLGYKMKVAAVEDVLRGKIWAYEDKKRRPSKRQKDLADIFRLVEFNPKLKDMLPESIKKMF